MSDAPEAQSKTPETIKQAWSQSPGPDTPAKTAILALKGAAMGTADIIPGVSGGTIAFITGIYEQLLAAIASFDLEAFKKLLRLDIKGFIAHTHLRFLIPLLFGIGFAIKSTAQLVHHLLDNHPAPTWSLFFGLIAASILVLRKEITKWSAGKYLVFALGVLGAFFITGMIPVTTPESAWFIFISGMIAICAMILPGISGSFLLLIMGKYLFVTGAIKDPFNAKSMMIIAVFGSGAVVGIMLFSRLLKWLLAHFHELTMCALMGIMVGAMRKIWPWKIATQTMVSTSGKVKVLAEKLVSPATYSATDGMDAQLGLCLALMVVGFVLVMVLDAVSRKKS